MPCGLMEMPHRHVTLNGEVLGHVRVDGNAPSMGKGDEKCHQLLILIHYGQATHHDMPSFEWDWSGVPISFAVSYGYESSLPASQSTTFRAGVSRLHAEGGDDLTLVLSVMEGRL